MIASKYYLGIKAYTMKTIKHWKWKLHVPKYVERCVWSWIERLNIVKMVVHSKLIYIFMQLQSKS